MSIVVVIVLHKFLILKMTVLLLNGVELVSKSEIVLVSLLDFEYLCFKLRNKEVFLVTCEVNRVVVLGVSYELLTLAI
jgi:hypothetical protein